MKQKNYIWVVAYVNADLIHKIPSDLEKSNQYKYIEYVIPTVSVLKKQLKNKDHFKEVPLLFNYGFFKIPILWALNIDLLNKIKNDIGAISNWVKDKAKRPGPKKGSKEDDWRYELGERDIPIATTNFEAISKCCRIAEELSIFSSEDINNLKEGAIVHLIGYPFEGMKAQVQEINLRNKKVKVLLANMLEHGENDDEETFDLPVEVHFDNIFYSIYQGSHHEDYNQETFLEDYPLSKKNKAKPEQDEI